MPRIVEDDISGQLNKKEKSKSSFEKNLKFPMNFRKCTFKEIKKLTSYITTSVQKSTRVLFKGCPTFLRHCEVKG